MDLDTLTSSIQCLNLDTGITTLADQIALITQTSTQIEQFNKSNETKFHFAKPASEQNGTGKLLLSCLKRSIAYLDKVEKFECPEAYSLTDSYYSLACHCLNSIRILSRDTDVIESFLNEELLDLIQQAADLKNLVINGNERQVKIKLNN